MTTHIVHIQIIISLIKICMFQHYRRSLTDRWSRALYQRDMRLTGNPYEVNVSKQLL